MVEVPVIPKTVQINAISAYHRGVFRGGMGLGARNLCRNVDDEEEEEVEVLGDDSAIEGGEGEPLALGSASLLLLLLLPPFHRRC
jgi:hypothetical protein